MHKRAKAEEERRRAEWDVFNKLDQRLLMRYNSFSRFTGISDHPRLSMHGNHFRFIEGDSFTLTEHIPIEAREYFMNLHGEEVVCE